MPKSLISFYERFEADILSGKKTITIRNRDEKDYSINSVVDVVTFESERFFTKLRVLGVNQISFDDLNESHARQENMSLATLKSVISEIYPNESELYVISFERVE